MLTSTRIAGSVLRSIFVFAGLSVVGSMASAQTAPQLLPYTSKLIAGGGAALNNGKCPVTGVTATDTYGDGCLATEIVLTAPRYAAADINGNIFFSDYTNGLIRRVDVITGIVTAVAGGAATQPGKNTACGLNLSVDSIGDGCLGTAVKLGKPAAIVFSPSGDLYFSDPYNYNVRKIAATGGLIATTGIISLVDGDNGGTSVAYGYTANNSSGNITAATAGYLDAPYGLAIDANGNLYIAEEYKNAVLVVNTNAAITTTVTGVSIPPGTVAKIMGAPTSGGPTCPNSPASTFGCNYGNYTTGLSANTQETDSPYGVALDAAGNVYFTNEYDNSVGKISSTGILTNYAGTYPLVSAGGTPAQTVRATAGTFGIGSDFGLTNDTLGNLYVTDALNGYIYRIDGANQSMYVVAGGATSATVAGAPCSTGSSFTATDTRGDGCPWFQATLGKNGTTYATTGVFGVSADTNGDIFFGDTVTNVIREVASGTQFGNVGSIQTDYIDLHFAAGDSPASSGAFTLTSGAANFTLGTATRIAVNSDNTSDYLLPITANPTVLGQFTGTLQVVAQLGGTVSFPLTGNYIQSPITRIAVSAAPSVATSCSGTTYSSTGSIVLTAKLTANGPSAPTGTITFSSNGTPIGSGVAVTNIGTSTIPVYGATLTQTFATAGNYSITATYVPTAGSYYVGSTAPSPATFATSAPGFTTALLSTQESTVAAGGTALYSFTVAQNLYSGTISFACTNLPAFASCAFSPANIVATGCSTTNTVALSILTQATVTTRPAGFGFGGGRWQMVGVAAGFGLAMLIGLRRRRFGVRFGQIGLALALLLAASGIMACGNGTTITGTPSGTTAVLVTITGADGTIQTFPVSLTVK